MYFRDWNRFDHKDKVKIVLNKLKAAGLNINAEISFFVRDNLDNLGFKTSRQGIIHLLDKVQPIQHIAVPINTKQHRSFIRVINYYRDSYVETQIRYINSFN